MTKKILASVLAFAMAVSTASVAFAAEGDEPAKGVATGDGFGSGVAADVTTEAKDAILQFQVPTTMTVALDPFQAGDATGSQVYSLDQAIWNKSNIAIRVTVKAGLVVGKDTTSNDPLAFVHEDPAEVDSTDPDNTKKDAYVELVAQQPTATTDRSGAVVVTPVVADGKTFQTEYTAEGADTAAKIILKENNGTDDLESQISFALQAATYTADRSGALAFSSMAADDKGVGTFRFMGSLNANADNWSGDDLSVRVVYDVNGLGSAAYDAMLGENGSVTDAEMKAANVYSIGAPASTPSGPSIGDAEFSLASPTDVVVTIKNGGDYDTVDGISAVGGKLSSATDLNITTDYTVNGTSITLLQGNPSNGLESLADTAGQEVTFTVILSKSADSADTKTVTFKVTFKA